MTERKRIKKDTAFEVKIFPVPLSLTEDIQNIVISTNNPSKRSKEQIINKAFKFHSEGKISEAAKYYQQCINLGFNDQRVFSNYGIILKNLGKSQEAENYYRKAIDLNPDYAEAHYNLGNLFKDSGKSQEAEKSYRNSIELNPDFAEAHNNLGFIFKDLGKLKDAENSYRKAIKLNPHLAEAHSNLGNILRDLGKLKDAEVFTRKAIELKPDFALAHSNLGNILSDLGKLKDAEVFTCKAIELNPDFAEAHSNLGNILRDLGKLQEAEISTRKAIELNPDFAEVHSNLGSILRDLGKLQEAEVSTRKAIELNPHFAKAHYNLGNILSDLGKLQEAEVFTRKAIALNPDYAEASWNLSLLQLLQGDYKNGLENYEFRSKIKKPITPHGKPKIKQVDNQNIEKEEKLLVISEQGLGDTLQYMRYIPYLRSQGLDVSFCALTKLHSLIQSSGIDHNPLTPQQSTLVSEGQWIPLLSLPRYLQITPEKPIITEPYIYSTEELNQKWKKILSSEKKPIIGINWQGNPELERSFYQGRSIPLESFSKLFDHNEITLLSLQKGFGSEQLNSCSFKNKFVQCQTQIDATWDFLENAAIIENCDLIITCDTSIAHLAGGMGKEVWLLLRDIPYWTWGVKGNHTFWYPSMKLFRQKERHNWQEVMDRVSSKLKKEMNTYN